MKNILLVLLAVIVGEAALVLLTTLVQETLFDGISWTHSPSPDLVLGGLGTFLSAVVAGFLASLVARRQHTVPLVIITLLITLETIWLIAGGRTTDPLWFDLLAGGSLIAGIWLGGWVNQRFGKTVWRKSLEV